jgi:hypothetical protein
MAEIAVGLYLAGGGAVIFGFRHLLKKITRFSLSDSRPSEEGNEFTGPAMVDRRPSAPWDLKRLTLVHLLVYLQNILLTLKTSGAIAKNNNPLFF